MDTDPLIPLTEAAEAAGISRTSLRRYIDDGRIQPHARTAGGHIRFRAQQLIRELSEAAERRRADR